MQSHQNPSYSTRLKSYNENNFEKIPQLSTFSEDDLHTIKVVSAILPFKVNQYVLDELIDWNNIPFDPMFQLTFPQKEMLQPQHFDEISTLIRSNSSSDNELNNAIKRIRMQLNPHPSNQLKNIPKMDGNNIPGIQHKYKETVLFFPSQGQTCFAYCTFCFRWPQFIGDKDLQFASKDGTTLCKYLEMNKQVTDVLFTGGDPMVMNTQLFESYFNPLLDPKLDHIQNIRIGTKSLTYRPHRFTSMEDADDLLRLFEKVIRHGKKIAVMAHFNHWRELQPDLTRLAIKRLQDVGVVIRSQGPLLRHINDTSDVWAKLWKDQVSVNIMPYYMFVERDTGPKHYFEIPLIKGWEVYKDAIKEVSGLARTARGPSMSTDYGKIEIQGVSEICNEKVIVLRFIQARNPEWVQRPFFAKYNTKAVWINDLEPAFGEEKFFFL